MAIERDIPQDICKYESKLIGPFTTRQVFCLVPGIALAVGAYLLLNKYNLAQDVKLFAAVTFLMPFLICGWYKPYGIPFEKFIQSIFVSIVLAPKHRLYKTKNTFEFLLEPDELPANAKKQKKEQAKKASYKSKNANLQPFK